MGQVIPSSSPDRDRRYAAELDVAREAARAAGKLLLEHFRAGVTAEYKGRGDLVTVADHESERLVRAIIAESFPDDLVVGEEGEHLDELLAGARRRWYVDPLDGTTNFVKGQPRWAVSIAFCDADDVLGACAIYRPCVDEEFVAAREGGAFMDELRLERDDDPPFLDALILLGPMAGMQPAIAEIARSSLSIRVTGSTVSDLADLAIGRADVYLGRGQGRWDVAAGTLLCREAGVRVTDMTGGELTGPSDNVVVGTAAAHAATIEALGGADRGDAAEG